MKDLNWYLENVNVLPPGMWENNISNILVDWYAVSNEEGIIAYFGNKKDAFTFRLNYINNCLNN